MIKQIQEINFPSYATLHQATVSLAEMGERTISTQIRIDGDIAPEFGVTRNGMFYPMELSFKGERFVLPVREPQAMKDNSTRNSLVDLTFQSWPIDQMKRYYFMEMASVEAGTYIPDKYVAPVSLKLSDFVNLLNQVLGYYFGNDIVAVLNPGAGTDEKVLIAIEHSHIWDVVTKIFDFYAVRWNLEYDSTNQRYLIKIGYPVSKIEDHDFEYGFNGGLLKFERQVQDADIANILLGRGGERNLPYRYFKIQDPQNPNWTADPDAVPELANIYFDRLRDANFRRYVQGWLTNSHYVQQTGYPAPREYDADRAEYDFAYAMGHFAEKFDPVEYVADTLSCNGSTGAVTEGGSIAKYGRRWGYVDNDDKIYPTIQGVINDNYGRIDEVVAVSPILSDDIATASRAASEIVAVDGITSMTSDIASGATITKHFYGGQFTVPADMTANLIVGEMFASCARQRGLNRLLSIANYNVSVYKQSDDSEVPPQGIPAGDYYYEIEVTVRNLNSSNAPEVTYGARNISLEMSWQTEAWKPTFEIWVKNIFGTAIAAGENDEDYAERVWGPILGDRVGNAAQIAFSDGFMSISEDYNFVIAKYPEFDQTKSFGGYLSEWKITLRKSDAEFDATGLYIPNMTTGGSPIAGDHFYFLGIDMPHAMVVAAEEKLSSTKSVALVDTSAISPTWVVSLDKVRITQQDSGYLQTLFERIGVGTELRIKDPRFTGGNVLHLIVKSITYTWDEASDDDPQITPNIEVVLSTEDEPGISTIQQLEADIKAVRQSSVQIADIENIIKRVAGPLFLRKSGESDLSHSPTRFANRISSEDFDQGGTDGQGWAAYRDENGKTIIEADRMIVREDLQVNSLVANQIAYIGGKRITSAAAMECILVEQDTTAGTYTCYFDQKQGTVKNLFQVGDIAMGQEFSPSNGEVRFYKCKVVGVSENSITLDASTQAGAGSPQKGDVIVQYGNIISPSRQFVIVQDVIDGGYIKMISDLNGVNSTGSTYFFAGSEMGAEELLDINGNQLYDKNNKKLYVKKNQARFFVGDDDSHIEYSHQTKQFTVKGTIVQSPSGSEFPIPSPRGEYDASATYYKGDMVTYQGQSWLRISSTPAVGDTPAVGNWMIYAEKGAQGAQGPAGASPLFRSDWDSTKSYYGDQYRIDVVKHGGVYYRAKTTAGTIAAGLEPGVSDKWALFGATFESVATGLLVAENAIIEHGIITKLQTSKSGKRIEAMDNVLEMYDDGEKKRLIVTGENVSITPAASQTTPTQINETYTVSSPSSPIHSDYTVSMGTFECTDDNLITIPAISISCIINDLDDDGGKNKIVGSARLQRLDGESWTNVGTSLGSFSWDTPGSWGTQIPATSRVVSAAGQYRIALVYNVWIEKVAISINAKSINITTATGTGKIIVSENEQIVRIGANGFSVSLGNEFMMNCAKDTENSNERVIEMIGKTSGGEITGVRLSPSGLQFIFNGVTYNASRNSSFGYLMLTPIS